MSRNKIIKIVFILLGVGILIIGGVGFYMFNMPHRDVQAAKSDYKLKASEIVLEYLENPIGANDKYLDDEGDSKILEITGKIASITTDFNQQKVVLLKEDNSKAGVTCTFTEKTNQSVMDLKEGQEISVKGVIRSGASYDEDLEMYENVIMEKCSLINNNQS
jgi:hypothetical protein